MTELREPSWFNRIVSSIVIISIGGLTVVPAVAAAQQEIERAIVQADENELSPEAEMSGVVLSIMSELGKIQSKLGAADDEESKKIVDTLDEDETLEQLTEQLAELDEEVMAGFDEIAVMLNEKDLPDVIVERHEQAVAIYRDELVALMDGVEQIRVTKDQKARFNRTTELANRLKSMKHKRSQQHFDPAELPSRSLRPNKANKPKLTALEFVEAYPVGDYRNLMADVNGSLPTGDDAFTNPDWLSESDEVQLTQPVIDKAVELGNDPVTIYHWVRNNIQWKPNWGAKQTAQLTMELGSGNAMDISSLAVGLMRAAGIPARYVHGTIDVPEEDFRNWAGGFNDVHSAIDYGASGGIPLGPVSSGGVVTKIRMEHIWVEVAVDFVPSRAAVNEEPDNWIAIDPSFMQFEHFDQLDQVAISAIDSNQMAQQFLDSGVVNETEGWVSSFDRSAIVTARTQVTTALDDYIATNLVDPNASDILGGKSVIVQEFPVLGAALKNRIIGNWATYSRIPDSLQQKMRFALDTNQLGELVSPLTIPWAVVNNQKITLSFIPASADDLNALNALLPDQSVSDINDFPGEIPAYLLNVTPELRVNDTVVLQGFPMSLGEEIDFRFHPLVVGFGELPNRYPVIAGSRLSIAAISNGVSNSKMTALEQNLLLQAQILESGTDAELDTISRGNLHDDVLHGAVLGYYSEYAGMSGIAARQQRAEHFLAAGLGSIGYEPTVDILFGVPRKINVGGVVGNLPIIRVIGADRQSGSQQPELLSKRDLNFVFGLISSALEHSQVEQLVDIDSGNTNNAFSAIKAIQLAVDENQLIYDIGPNNISAELGSIDLAPETRSEIQSSVASGKRVIVHAQRLLIAGYFGTGYIIYDPETGDGAYKISGGQNGVTDVNPLTSLSFSLGALSGGLEEGADRYAGDLAKQSLLFKSEIAAIRLAERIAVAAQFLGFAVLAGDIVSTLANPKLSSFQKAGQISTAMFGFGVASIGGAAIAALIPGGPLVAVLVVAMFVATLSLVIADFNLIYFSSAVRDRLWFRQRRTLYV